MDLKITPEQFREVMEEQLENQRLLRKQQLKEDLKAFAIVVICIAVMCIAAELDSPLILFVFVLGTGIYIMLKVKPQDKKKSLNNGTVYNVIFRSVILLIIKMSKQLEAIFGRNAQIVVLGYLLRHHDSVTYLSGIAEATGLSHSSVARVIEPLLEMGIVREENCGKQIRTFRINKDSGVYKLLIRFVDDLDKVLSE